MRSRSMITKKWKMWIGKDGEDVLVSNFKASSWDSLRELISEHVSNSADKKSLSKTALWLQLLQLC